MKADDAKRSKELEREKSQLKRIIADLTLDNSALKEVLHLHMSDNDINNQQIARTPEPPVIIQTPVP
jgi:hypothetical protein